MQHFQGKSSSVKSSNKSFLNYLNWKRYFIFIFILCFLTYFNISSILKCDSRWCLYHNYFFRKETSPGFLVHTPTCKISEMDPMDPSVLPHLKETRAKACKNYLVKVSDQTLTYDKSHPKYNITSCCYREIHRVAQNPKNYTQTADWQIRYSGTCTPITKSNEGTPMTSEFVRVECEETRNNKSSTTSDFLATTFSPERHSNLTRDKAKYWEDKLASLSPEDIIKNGYPGTPPSVLIVGIDSISRLHMMRSMPKTKEFLEANDFVELKGYTKIGDNTFPNIMGSMGGMELYQYPCWPHWHDKLDDCPFIWKNFSRSKYVSALLEDSPGLAIFNYHKTGFVEQPVDYFLRTIAVGYHGKLAHDRGYSGCVGGMSQTDFMLNYMRNFFRRMGEGKFPYFLLSWFTSVAHDNINGLKPKDEDFRDLLSDTVYDEAYNGNNTVILFISDHGYRFGKFRETFLGYYEESLPFFFMRLPPALKASHPHWYDNLQRNSHRLTSPLDFHATLEDILSLSASSAESFPFTHGNWKSSADRKVYSFFEETPLNRTCESSGIPQFYCRCGVAPAVGKTTPTSVKFGELIMSSVNTILDEAVKNNTCIPLKFDSFLYVRELSEGEVWNNFGKLITYKDHIVALTAKPSDARFEAKIRLFSNDTMSIVGDISRINSYEGQIDCLSDMALKNYCMCKDYYEKRELSKKTKEAKKKQTAKKKEAERMISSTTKSTNTNKVRLSTVRHFPSSAATAVPSNFMSTVTVIKTVSSTQST